MTAEMSAGFTGTRLGMTPSQRMAVSDLLAVDPARVREVHHGDCIGADAEMHTIAGILEIPVVVHPPEVPTFRAWCKRAAEYRPPAPYWTRNLAIVQETDFLIAAPRDSREIGGTWLTVKFARRLLRPVAIVSSSGLVSWERWESMK